MKFNPLLIVLSFVFLLSFTSALTSPILSPSEVKSGNFVATTLNGSYDELVNSWYATTSNVTKVFNNQVYSPWFSSSSSCSIADLKTDCYSSPNMTAFCMVTDEFSVLGLGLSMGINETRFDQFYNTLSNLNQSVGAGTLPAWRLSVNGGTITAYENDTASDADARIIIALYNAGNNSYFSQANRTKYLALANQMSQDFVRYDLITASKFSSLGQGNITYHMVTGRNIGINGAEGLGYGTAMYSGYYQDGIIAMIQAYSNTGNSTYLNIARNLTLDYLEASKFNGVDFSVPPTAFEWDNLTGIMTVTCSRDCSPSAHWDDADAPRASGLGMVEYYANITNITIPLLTTYNNAWRTQHAQVYNSWAYRYWLNGSAYGANQSGYKAQSLQSQLLSGSTNVSLFNNTLRDALGHYSSATQSMDSASCMGLYSPGMTVRSLGMAIGRDAGSFSTTSSPSENLNCSVNGILFTLFNPVNASTVLGTSAVLSFSVQNNNVSNVTDTTPYIYYNYTNFSTAGFNGGSVTPQGWLNISSSVFTPDNDLDSYDTYKLVINGKLGDSLVNPFKIFPLSPVDSTGNGDRYYFEWDGGTSTYALKQEPAYPTVVSGIGINSNYTLTINVNKTGYYSNASIVFDNGTISSSGASSDIPFSVDMNSSVTNPASAIEMSGTIGGEFFLYSWEVWNMGTPLTHPGNSSMNVSIKMANGTVLDSTNYFVSGNTYNYTWNNAPIGNNVWYVNAVSTNNNVDSCNFAFTVNPYTNVTTVCYNNGTCFNVTSGNNYNVGENANLTFTSDRDLSWYFSWLVDGIEYLAGIGQNVFNYVFDNPFSSPNSTVNLQINSPLTAYKLCYQESANISNQTGTDTTNCNLNYTGRYNLSSIPSGGNLTKVIDGSYATGVGANPAYNFTFLINYTVPEDTISTYSYWQIKDINFVNLTLDPSCMNRTDNKLILEIIAIADTNITYLCRDNNYDSKVLLTYADIFFFYEEAMYWNVSYIGIGDLLSNETYNINTNSQNPNINIVYPANGVTYTQETAPSQLNYTFSDATTSTCGYSLNGAANQSITCSANTTSIVGTVNVGSNTIILYASDIVGNVNSSSSTFTWIQTAYNSSNVIYQCGVIDQPGNYIINQSLTSSGTCINITANNVHIDGNAQTVTGSYSYYGVSLTNTTLKNINSYGGINITGTNNNLIFNNSFGNITYNSVPYLYERTCYQESANISNQTGIDGSCGIIYTGNYSCNGNTYGQCNRFFDGSWSTGAGNNGYPFAFYTNYTVPINATGAVWRIGPANMNGELYELNISIPSSCISNKIILNNNATASSTQWYCQNISGGNWINLYGHSGWFNEYNSYEEGIYWQMGNNISWNGGTSGNVQIKSNLVSVDSVALPALNTTANITLNKGVTTYPSPFIRRNAEACPSSICTQYTANLNDAVVTFGVAHFTNYSISGTPQIVISNPTTIVDYGYLGKNETLNFTVTDDNIASVWYNYNGTNISVSATSGVPNIAHFTLTSKQNVTVYANDTDGNWGSNSFNWSYKVFENSQNYVSSTYSLVQNLFSLNFTASNISSIVLNYNNTNYTATTYPSGSNTIASVLVTAPIVVQDTNISFYWIITLNDSSVIQLNPRNQTITYLTIGNTYPNLIYNITVRDETSGALIPNTAVAMTYEVTYGISNTSIIGTKTFSDNNYSNKNISSNIAYSFYLSGNIIYSAVGYIGRTYQFEEMNISSPQNITLYLTNSNTSYVKTILVTDEAGRGKPALYRQYTLVDGIQSLVASEQLDSTGRSTISFIPNIQYVFEFTTSGCTDLSKNIIFYDQSDYVQVLSCSSYDPDDYVDPFERMKVSFSPDGIFYVTNATNLSNSLFSVNVSGTSSFCSNINALSFNVYNSQGVSIVNDNSNTCDVLLGMGYFDGFANGRLDILLDSGQTKVLTYRWIKLYNNSDYSNYSILTLIGEVGNSDDILGIDWKLKLLFSLIGLLGVIITLTYYQRQFNFSNIITLIVVDIYLWVMCFIGWGDINLGASEGGITSLISKYAIFILGVIGTAGIIATKEDEYS